MTEPMTTITYAQRTRDDPDFYCLMGPLFGSREVVRELGMPMYDDPGRIWCLAQDAAGRVVACSSLAIQGKKGIFKSAWVAPAWRRQGIYDHLFAERLAIAATRGVTTIAATATILSLATHLRYGFRQIGTRGRYYLMKKEIEHVR